MLSVKIRGAGPILCSVMWLHHQAGLPNGLLGAELHTSCLRFQIISVLFFVTAAMYAAVRKTIGLIA